MKADRRTFLRAAAVSSAAALSGKPLSAGPLRQTDPTGSPLVVSTWAFGQTANKGAWEVLRKDGLALDAVEAGVRIPEADPTNQTIGLGGLPDRDGRVTLDACIMDHQYNCGSVMCLEHIVHAISVARLVMEKTPHIVLAGEGALRFALANGFQKENLLTPESEKAWKEWLKTANYHPEINIENRLYDKQHDPMPGGPGNHDTIGMLARDSQGRLSGACTTSGLAYKMHGRVGDSPIIGAGLYVDNEVGAATASGVGEEVIRIVGSHLVVELMRQGHSPEEACREAVNRIVSRNPQRSRSIQVGFVALNKQGEYGGYSLQPGFVYSVTGNNIDRVFPAKNYYSSNT
ncbi:MAG: N(4)-(beta-N-acetylglucosaminyl)-L-asparaginase [Chitinophagaceae bacterium]|nr:N(4)-(beta-N-acetylglucosaminyl)-L-asparaginase [Chitinophagaceae bacterium]